MTCEFLMRMRVTSALVAGGQTKTGAITDALKRPAHARVIDPRPYPGPEITGESLVLIPPLDSPLQHDILR